MCLEFCCRYGNKFGIFVNKCITLNSGCGFNTYLCYIIRKYVSQKKSDIGWEPFDTNVVWSERAGFFRRNRSTYGAGRKQYFINIYINTHRTRINVCMGLCISNTKECLACSIVQRKV